MAKVLKSTNITSCICGTTPAAHANRTCVCHARSSPRPSGARPFPCPPTSPPTQWCTMPTLSKPSARTGSSGNTSNRTTLGGLKGSAGRVSNSTYPRTTLGDLKGSAGRVSNSTYPRTTLGDLQGPPGESTLPPTIPPTLPPTQAPTRAPTRAPTDAPTDAPTERSTPQMRRRRTRASVRQRARGCP
jgi:hypothetical protein